MRRIVAVLAATVMALTACGGDGLPQSFDADPGEIDVVLVPALVGSVEPDVVPKVQRDFLEGCVLGGGDEIPQRSTVQQQGLLAVCGCSYLHLVDLFRAEARTASPTKGPDALERDAVALFRDVEDALRDGGELPAAVTEAVAGCIESTAF